MSKLVSEIERKNQEIRYRDRLIVVSFFTLIVLSVAYFRIPTQFTTYYPPDPAHAYRSKAGSIPHSYIYSFAVVLLERLMYCERDCYADYKAALDTNKALITDRCYHDLLTHHEVQNQLVRNRTRQLTPFNNESFNASKVYQIDESSWIVTEKMKYHVKLQGKDLRTQIIQYPMTIIRTDLSPELNPYQLQFDCFAGEPKRIE